MRKFLLCGNFPHNLQKKKLYCLEVSKAQRIGWNDGEMDHWSDGVLE